MNKLNLALMAAGMLCASGLQAMTATASSEEKKATKAEFAVDGKNNTRWSSKFSDNQWLTVDLGKKEKIEGVTIKWETAYGKEYKIQVSDDGKKWTDAFVQKDGKGKKEVIKFSKAYTTQFIRVQGIKRGTKYGYSIYELTVIPAK